MMFARLVIMLAVMIAFNPAALFGQCSGGRCSPSSFQIGPAPGSQFFNSLRPYRAASPACPNGQCSPADCENGQCKPRDGFTATAGAREVDSDRLREALDKMKREGRTALTAAEFEALFINAEKKPARNFKPLKFSTADDFPMRTASLVMDDENTAPTSPMPDPMNNFGVDFERIIPGTHSKNGAKMPKETLVHMLQERAAKFDDISGKRWVVVVGTPDQQKKILSQLTPAMVKEITLKTLTPQQVKERDLNYSSNDNAPVITVTEPDGRLVMNKTGDENAGLYIGQSIPKYDPAKDPDRPAVPTPSVPTPVTPVAPAAPVNPLVNIFPGGIPAILQLLLPLILGLIGGNWWQKKAAEAVLKQTATAEQAKQLAELRDQLAKVQPKQ
jgi:hypothetical protein